MPPPQKNSIGESKETDFLCRNRGQIIKEKVENRAKMQ